MRVHKQGASVRVTVSSNEVYFFKQKWPCSELPDRSISFVFDTKSGDLIDLYPVLDGDGILALSEDARKYAAKRLKLWKSGE